VGADEGLPDVSVITCDNLVTLPKAMLAEEPVGRLDLEKRAELDRALRYALDIQY
jgi:mRNA-degrading endonuclease toxin of MazEF toxin-antitoxin module